MTKAARLRIGMTRRTVGKREKFNLGTIWKRHVKFIRTTFDPKMFGKNTQAEVLGIETL